MFLTGDLVKIKGGQFDNALAFVLDFECVKDTLSKYDRFLNHSDLTLCNTRQLKLTPSKVRQLIGSYTLILFDINGNSFQIIDNIKEDRLELVSSYVNDKLQELAQQEPIYYPSCYGEALTITPQKIKIKRKLKIGDLVRFKDKCSDCLAFGGCIGLVLNKNACYENKYNILIFNKLGGSMSCDWHIDSCCDIIDTTLQDIIIKVANTNPQDTKQFIKMLGSYEPNN